MAATLRLWHSSPIRSACAVRLRRSTGPRAARARASAGASVVRHPPQSIEHIGAVGAEAQHRPEPFVQRREGAVARRRIVDDDHRHRRREDPRHRPDRAVMVTRGEVDRPVARRAARPPRRWPPSPRTGRRRSPRRASARTCAPTRWAVPRAGSCARRVRAPRARPAGRRPARGARPGGARRPVDSPPRRARRSDRRDRPRAAPGRARARGHRRRAAASRAAPPWRRARGARPRTRRRRR